MLETIIVEKPQGVTFFFDDQGRTYIELLGLQFSFHAVPRRGAIAVELA